MTVYTIGYEGRTIMSFIEALSSNGIQRIIDIRETPISRKAGFSKSLLSHYLESVGIDYIHIKGLGSPKPIRDRLHQTNNYSEFFNAYRDYIGGHFEYIQEAWELAEDKKTCLMCFEKKPQECHRSVVADYMLQVMPDVEGVVNL